MSPKLSIFDRVEETAQAVKKRVPTTPAIGLVLGSGLGAFAESLDGLTKIPYAELPHLPASNVVGHAGNFCFGTAGGVPVVCMQGRVHLYEGHSVEDVVQGARTMARLGAKAVLITNAAGGIHADWAPGELMVITDHLNLTGRSPLVGPNDDRLGPRFPDMTVAYDHAIRKCALDIGERLGIELRRGVYAGLLGPSYETPAEVRMLRELGADAVGMSTVLEVVALRHMGVRVGALSCITNQAAGISAEELNHAEVEQTARTRQADLLKFLGAWIVDTAKELA